MTARDRNRDGFHPRPIPALLVGPISNPEVRGTGDGMGFLIVPIVQSIPATWTTCVGAWNPDEGPISETSAGAA
jgi:hypothetical protein